MIDRWRLSDYPLIKVSSYLDFLLSNSEIAVKMEVYENWMIRGKECWAEETFVKNAMMVYIFKGMYEGEDGGCSLRVENKKAGQDLEPESDEIEVHWHDNKNLRLKDYLGQCDNVDV